MKIWKNSFLIAIISIVGNTAFAQKTTRGIVVDSISLKALEGVHVRIKNSNRGEVTNANGVFVLPTSAADTLVLTMLGYKTLEVPLFFEEEDILIRLSESVHMLKEITISGTRLFQSEIVRAQRTQPHKMATAEAFSSPWEYFSKGQREKRKVVKLINENDRIKTYIQVINDQEIREEIIDAHGLTEAAYYNGLATFNQQSNDVLYATDPSVIITSLKSFFNRMYP